MAMDIYYSQYLLILAPSLVITLMFLFFWLFMKETSYDEVLARQKRDLKLPPSKPDNRKKNEKKKIKKKESASGVGGGGGGESEEELRDFDVADGASSSIMEIEEVPAPVATPDPTQLTPTTYVPVSVSPEAPASLRERKKKEKKAAKAATAAAASSALSSEEPVINGSKLVSRKTEQPLTMRKPPSPPPVQPDIQVQVQVVQAPLQAQAPPQVSGKKKEKKKQKPEPVDDQQPEEVKAEQAPAPAPVKKERPIVAETKALDGAAPTATSGKKKSAKKQRTEPVDEAHVLLDSGASANHQAPPNDNAPSKGSGKKQKNETDKENTQVKLKELLSGLSSLTLSETEAVSVMVLLHEKSPSALDTWHKSAARPDPAAQERERFISTLQEEASIAKDKVKQLSQELQVEKQKTSRVEAVMREQRAAMEKELGSMQAKAQGSYQELQTMQIKFQQFREQLESQITQLQQENGILRDAVSSATNQMESKNSAEVNKLRQEYASLMKELADSNGKLQQEEHQRKSLEVSYNQNVSQLEVQLQDAKRRWEELQNFLHNINAEREKLQASNQELHGQLLAAETEMSNKNKEIQTLHSSLTDAVVSKERLEQRVVELMEMSQHSMPDDSLQDRVQELMSENKDLQVQNESMQAQISSQATHVSHIEEIQKLLADKELQRKSLEDSLNAERSSGASKEIKMQALHNENMSLKADIQNLQARISDQAASQLALDQFQKSVWEKEENMKTVESLLEKGLIEVANKEEDLKAVREENEALKREIEAVKRLTAEQMSSESTVKDLQSKIQNKDVKLKSMKESLQAAQDSCLVREKTAEALEQQLAALQAEMGQLRQKETSAELTSSSTQLQELQAQLVVKEQEIQVLQAELKARIKELSEKMEQMHQQQSHTAEPSPELLTLLSEKDQQVSALNAELAELRDSLERQRKKNNELREKNWSAMEALSSTESILQQKLSKAVKEEQTALEMSQAECKDVLHRLLPNVPLPNEQNHQEWLQRFESAAAECSDAQSTPVSGDSEALAKKLKEAEETQRILQKDCETYKKLLAEMQSRAAEPSPELLTLLSEKNKQVSDLKAELVELGESLEFQRKKNNEEQTKLEMSQAECRDVLHRLLPNVPLPSEQNHQGWLGSFERAATESSAAQSTPASGDSEALTEKLKEAEETQRILQKDCETYKKVLAETEGILQRLQNSVEQEESRWRVKLELSQGELREMSQKVTALQQEIESLTDGDELENLRREKQHLESELERAERESATYVTEVRELKDLLTELQTRLDGSYTEAIRQNEELNLLKTQLTETLSKLETEENERQKVAGDLYKAQQSLDLIQGELSKVADNADELINPTSQREEIDKKEKMTAGLNETVKELQQLLQTVSRQLAKGQEGDTDKDLSKV